MISFHVIGIDPGNHYGIFVGQVWLQDTQQVLNSISNVNAFFWFSCTQKTFVQVMKQFLENFVKLNQELQQKRSGKLPLWLIFIEDQFITYKRSSLKLSWNAGYVYGFLEALMQMKELNYRGPIKVHPSYWYNLFMRPEPESYYQPEFMETFKLRADKLVKVGYSYPRQSQHAFEAFLIAIAGLVKYLEGSRKEKRRR